MLFHKLNIAHCLSASGLALICSGALCTRAHAAAIASDVASNYTTATWITGSNGGTGFGAWTIDSTASFNEGITNSNGNSGSPNINTADVAFKIQREGSFNQVQRGFTVGGPNSSNELGEGQAFKFSLDWATLGNNQSAGLWLTDSGSGERWGLQSTGLPAGDGSGNLILKTNGGSNQDTGIPVLGLNNGANVTFTVQAGGAWTAKVEKLGDGGGVYNLSSSTFGTLTALPTGFRFFVAANTGTRNHYINNLEIANIPEPASMALLSLVGAGLLGRRRRA